MGRGEQGQCNHNCPHRSRSRHVPASRNSRCVPERNRSNNHKLLRKRGWQTSPEPLLLLCVDEHFPICTFNGLLSAHYPRGEGGGFKRRRTFPLAVKCKQTSSKLKITHVLRGRAAARPSPDGGGGWVTLLGPLT
ncbi:parathyroid hormone/parathyroid hormone-related peptide receptor [Platysternon megacephalum]|uniref:Parathyroid hormone/parathyroid hormone-related peptide receptor n=1 Tax=Platysternon megacephalum TaxID=55544 RepID=A0A4D9EFM2_9SAUR|nr:parathyroid hormone/parathyroid hormone-related peptide receptor [Platysternon megacephalum]